VRLNLFWKLALAFLTLLFVALLGADYSAERALRRDYERTGLEQLEAVARIGQNRAPVLTSIPPTKPEEVTGLQAWVREMAASGARITVITAQGLVLADSQSDPQTMENHAGRPELRDALANGSGHSIRHSVTINRDLLYYAVRQPTAAGQPVLLRFALPLSSVTSVLMQFRESLWLASLLILGVIGGATLLVSRQFANRVDRLTAFSKRVAEGDFHAEPSGSSGDALDSLGSSLNQTAARLDQTIRTLTEERNLSSAILGSMVEGVAVVNASERVLFSNPSFASILGLGSPPQPGSGLVEVVRQTELIEAVRKVLGGEIYWSEKAAAMVATKVPVPPKKSNGFAVDCLSERELQIFEMIGLGNSTQQISELLKVDVSTVDTYRSRIKDKLHLASGPELLQTAIRWSLNKTSH